jgi:signal peptidase II|tara:strand:+ start:8536 stop:9003 length:468 start_codon:yes stop_codon:yes gene_type:complete
LSRISIFIYLCFLVGLDLGLKSLAINNFTQFETIPFLPFLNFYLTYNSGIAFSMFDFGPGASSYILLLIGLFIVVFLLKQLIIEARTLSQAAYIFIIGGALGNIIDRAGDGVVTDFLHLYINNFSFFIFNPADAFISLGAILLITSELKMQKSNG